MTRPVYITATGAFLPNNPVSNDEMEDRVGIVAGKRSRYRSRILKSNGIEQRYYAIDENGQPTHLNQDLAKNAIETALASRGISAKDIGMLATGTTIPDLLMPGFASMVHGAIGGGPMDILSSGGVCASGAAALKAAWLAVAAGEHEVAVSVGSERSSAMAKSSRFEAESVAQTDRNGEVDSFNYFNADFLRWMLSDGAGAFVLESKPAPTGLSLKVEWMKLTSYAHDMDTCMYLGTSNPNKPDTTNTWLSYPSVSEADAAGLMITRQDTRLLARGIPQMLVQEFKRLGDAGLIDGDKIDHFVPHISSYFFSDVLTNILNDAGTPISKEKWFMNLKTKGNTGAASIYIAVDEAMRQGLFKHGERILLMIPESGRFSVSLCMLECVDPSKL